MIQVGKVAVHFRTQSLSPPIQEMPGVVRQHRAHVATHLLRVEWIARHTWHIAGLVLGCFGVDGSVCGDSSSIDIAIDLLRDPIGCEGRPEAAEHMVAGKPPATNIKKHRRNGIGAMQIVVNPEQIAFALLPFYGEIIIAIERAQDSSVMRNHWTSSLK